MAEVFDISGGFQQAQLARRRPLYTGAQHDLLNETNRDEMQRDVLGWLGKIVQGEGTRQCNRTASSKCQVRRISITSYSRASAGGNAW